MTAIMFLALAALLVGVALWNYYHSFERDLEQTRRNWPEVQERLAFYRRLSPSPYAVDLGIPYWVILATFVEAEQKRLVD